MDSFFRALEERKIFKRKQYQKNYFDYVYWDQSSRRLRKCDYIFGDRAFARKQTSRKIRSFYRDEISKAVALDDYDNIYTMTFSDYRKYFDYDWLLW